MTITNGYATLAEAKERIKKQALYTAATLSFTASSKIIADTAYGLKRYQTGDVIEISGSGSNDGYYTVATGNVANTLVVSETLQDEDAGASVTISQVSSTANPVQPIDDTLLEELVEAASRRIDGHTGRRFYAASETRYYTAESRDTLFVEDLLSVTTLKTDDDGDRTYENTWATTDYDLMPFNAALESPARPYTWIEVAPQGDYTFPLTRKGVQIAGSFGFAANAPAPVREACLLIAARLWKRKDAVLGVAGASGFGEILMKVPIDPDVEDLLKPYVPWGR